MTALKRIQSSSQHRPKTKTTSDKILSHQISGGFICFTVRKIVYFILQHKKQHILCEEKSDQKTKEKLRLSRNEDAKKNAAPGARALIVNSFILRSSPVSIFLL